MRTRARVLATALICAAMVAVAAGAATASLRQVDIAPAGESTASGTLTFATDNHEFSCSVTLAGTLVATATGETGIGFRPEVNPQIGDMQSFAASGCSPSGASIALV